MSLQGAELSIDVQALEAWRRRLTVTVPANAVDGERAQALKQLSGRMRLPGFRKGRIPAAVLEKRFGPSVEREVLDRVVRAAYQEAIQREDLHPISEGEIDTLDYEPGRDLAFTISFDIRPVVEVERTGGFVVQRPAAEVAEADVEAVLERLRHQNGAWAPAEGRPENNDLVHVEVTNLGEEAGEPQPYEFVLGQGEAIPDVEDAIRTLETGGQGEFTITFPDDFPNEARRGQQEQVRVALQGRKVLELPALDDDFARSVGDFDGVEALTARVREDLEKEAGDRAENQVRHLLMQQVAEANPLEVPSSMVDRYIEGALGSVKGADPERLGEIRERLRPEAEAAVKRILLLERIAEVEQLSATEEDIDARIEEIAARSGTSPAEVYGRLQKAGRIESLEREITEEKVFEFLKGRSEIVDPA
ncbi:MAG: trigger factor [Gemmatimonadota bacterium]|nr:trigger factor [Gemmatimonadota bacterium]